MAIYSLNHRTVGRSTHAPRTAGCHVRYITRPQAATAILGARMPLEPTKARAWMDAQETRDRINARVIDKVMVALPIELNAAQRVRLVRDFAEGMSQGRTPWIAGIHDGPADADNPHAHIIFRDRDIKTGKRVMELSEKGSTSRLRTAWQDHANSALERAGFEARIDHRSLEAQGIDRDAGIHVGQAAQVLAQNGEIPERLMRHQRRVKAFADPQLEWTERGGMAAQQRSAAEWVRASRERNLAARQRGARLSAFLADRASGEELEGPDFDPG